MGQLPTISGEYRVMKDPRIHWTPKGMAMLNIRASAGQKRRDGETYDNFGATIVVFGDRAEGLAGILKEGDYVNAYGTVRDNEYTDKEGTTHYTREINTMFGSCGMVLFPDDTTKGQGQGQQGGQNQGQYQGQNQGQTQDPFAGMQGQQQGPPPGQGQYQQGPPPNQQYQQQGPPQGHPQGQYQGPPQGGPQGGYPQGHAYNQPSDQQPWNQPGWNQQGPPQGQQGPPQGQSQQGGTDPFG